MREKTESERRIVTPETRKPQFEKQVKPPKERSLARLSRSSTKHVTHLTTGKTTGASGSQSESHSGVTAGF